MSYSHAFVNSSSKVATVPPLSGNGAPMVFTGACAPSVSDLSRGHSRSIVNTEVPHVGEADGMTTFVITTDPNETVDFHSFRPTSSAGASAFRPALTSSEATTVPPSQDNAKALEPAHAAESPPGSKKHKNEKVVVTPLSSKKKRGPPVEPRTSPRKQARKTRPKAALLPLIPTMMRKRRRRNATTLTILRHFSSRSSGSNSATAVPDKTKTPCTTRCKTSSKSATALSALPLP